MRTFEIILLLTGTITSLCILIYNQKLNKKTLLLFITSTFFSHLIFEGFRWQMIPSYLIISIIVRYIFKGFYFFKKGWFLKISSGLIFVILLLIAWSLPLILPIFKLPIPTGKYSIGSQYVHLKTDLEEIITKNPTDKRELVLKVWYPAVVTNEHKEPYFNKGERLGFSAKYGLPTYTFNYLSYVKTNTFINPNIAEGKFPVLIFSHGYYSNASGYYALIEEIVSQGFIVININHTYESMGTLFPDGIIKFYDIEYDRKINNREMATMVWSATENYKKATNQNEQFAAIENLMRNYVAVEITNRWSKDISVVIDKLKEGKAFSFFNNHFDTSKIGVFGHSQGGAAVGQALIDDSRIKAGINIDGVQWGKMIDTTMTKPFMLISSDWNNNHPNFNTHAFSKGSLSDFYEAKILNSGHSNFMDIPLMINLNLINEAGTINPKRAQKITAGIISNFFDKYLSDNPSDLLKLTDRYPELELIKKEK